MTHAYRAGLATAALTAVLTVWTTIVRDDGTGMSDFLVVMAAVVGAFACQFEAAGMARTMVGVGIMRALLALATATAPVTANAPGGPQWALSVGAVFTLLWLASALCFRSAARTEVPAS